MSLQTRLTKTHVTLCEHKHACTHVSRCEKPHSARSAHRSYRSDLTPDQVLDLGRGACSQTRLLGTADAWASPEARLVGVPGPMGRALLSASPGPEPVSPGQPDRSWSVGGDTVPLYKPPRGSFSGILDPGFPALRQPLSPSPNLFSRNLGRGVQESGMKWCPGASPAHSGCEHRRRF